MSPEKMVKRFQEGDTAIFPALWAAVKPLACRLALRYAQAAERNGGFDNDDLCQLAAIGVWTAAQNYDCSQNAKFSTWFPYHVRRIIRQALLLYRPCIDNIPTAALDGPVQDFDGEATLLDTIADEAAIDPAQAAEQGDLKRIVHEALDRIPAEERDAVRLVHLEGKTHKEAAALLGVPWTTVSGRVRDGRRKLRSSPRLRSVYTPDSLYHVGISRFMSTWTSSVEEIVMRKERSRLDGQIPSLGENLE